MAKTYIIVDGQWVEGEPVVGEKFKKVDDKGGELISFYSLPEDATPEVNTRLTRIKFKQRMTAAERIAVRAAADVNPIIFDFLDLVSDATYIDLSLPETIAGVSYLESESHLAVGRADEILLTPVTQDEAYNV